MPENKWQQEIKHKTTTNSFVDYCKEVEQLLEQVKIEIKAIKLTDKMTLAEKGKIFSASENLLVKIYHLIYGFRFYKVSPETEKVVLRGYYRDYNFWRKQCLYIRFGDKEYVNKYHHNIC